MQTTSPNIRAVARRPEQAHSDNTSSRSPLATALALAAMSLGLGVVQLDITIVNTALSSIGASLGGSVAELQWVVTAYTIAFAAFILTAGALGDRLGAKRIFMAGFAIFTLASLACALAPSAVFLIVARSVQGLAAAILVPNSLTLLNHAYADPKERGRAVGFWAAGASVALTAGPFVGGVLIALVGWRSIFLVNLPIGAAGLWLAWRYAEETPRLSQREIDLPGQTAAVSERLGAPQTIALASVITAVGCVALLPMASDTSYWAIGAQLLVLGGGLGLLVPPLTSTLLGSVDKSRSGIAAGVLNATRQAGSALGVALFGSLDGGRHEVIAGAHPSLVLSAAVLLAGAVAIAYDPARHPRRR